MSSRGTEYIEDVVNHPKWKKFLLTPIPQEFIAQLDQARNITAGYEKLAAVFDIQYVKPIFLKNLANLTDLCYEFIDLTASYFKAHDNNDREMLREKLTTLNTVFYWRVVVHKAALENVKTEALLCFESAIGKQYGYEQFALYLMVFKAWEDGRLTTDKMLEQISVFFSNCPHFVNGINFFLEDGYQVEYMDPNCTIIYHPGGGKQIFQFE